MAAVVKLRSSRFTGVKIYYPYVISKRVSVGLNFTSSPYGTKYYVLDWKLFSSVSRLVYCVRNKNKSQSFKARRDESKGMEKAMGKGAYSGASTMAKKGKMIKARGGVMVRTKLNGDLYTETF